MPVTMHGSRRERLGRAFRFVWMGQAVSQLGDYIAFFTLPAFVAELTRRATDFGIVFAAENIPTLLFGFVGGVVLDRVNLRLASVVADLARAAAFILLAFNASSESLSIAALVAIAFFIGSMAAAFNSALQAFIPAVATDAQLPAANARLSLAQTFAFAVGPAIGGLIVGIWGFGVAFAINAATFAISALSLTFVRPIRDFDRSRRGVFTEDLKAGFTYLWRHTQLRLASLGAAAVNLVTGFVEATLVLVGREVLGIEDFTSLGIVFAAIGVSSIVGSLSGEWVIDRLGLGRSFIVGMGTVGVGAFALALQSTLPGAIITLSVAFIGVPWLNIALVTMRQVYTPKDMLGRVISASRAVAWSSLPVGAMLSGVLADRVFGFRTTAMIGPGLLVLAALVLMRSALWSATVSEDG